MSHGSLETLQIEKPGGYRPAEASPYRDARVSNSNNLKRQTESAEMNSTIDASPFPRAESVQDPEREEHHMPATSAITNLDV